MKVTNRLVAQSADMGALNQFYAVTDPRAETCQYIGPKGRSETKGYPSLVQPVAAAKDRDTASRVWRISEDLTGVRFDLPVA